MKYLLLLTLMFGFVSCQNETSQSSTDTQNIKRMIVIKGQGINKVLSSTTCKPEKVFIFGENEYQLIYDGRVNFEEKAKELSDQGFLILESRIIKVMNLQR